MALATVKDFEDRYGTADDRVSAFLDDASALVLSAVDGSEADWATEESDEVPAAVMAVVLAITYRAWNNPAGLRSESLGAYSQSWRGDSEDVLWLTKAERRIVRRAAGTGTFRTVTLESPYSGDESGAEIFENDIPLDD